MRLALYQPEIAGNVGALIRLCACMGTGLDIIEPCGFPWNDRKVRASAMDYYDHAKIARHQSWDDFNKIRAGRVVLLTTKSDLTYINFSFEKGDILLAGSESAGVPAPVHQAADAAVTIPMAGGLRSLNVATACAMVLGEGLRQTRDE